MEILSINPAFNQFNKINSMKNAPETPVSHSDSTNLSSPAEITGRSLVNFKGLQMHKLDKLFVDTLAKELNIDAKNSKKLEDIVSSYIKDTKIASLADIGGDEFIDEQCDLIEKIQSVFQFPDIKYEYLVDEITNRCDSGNSYRPQSLGDQLLAQMEIESMLFGAMSRMEDMQFAQLMGKCFKLNDDDVKTFRNILLNYQSENKLSSIKELAKDPDENNMAVLLSRLSDNLDLSDNQVNMLAHELISYIHAKPNEYVSHTLPIDNDIDVFEAVCTKYGYSDIESQEFFSSIRNFAVDNGCSSVFEVFNDPKLYEQLSQESGFQSLPVDLVIDMANCVKNIDSLGLNVLKTKERDIFYAGITDMIILTKIKQEYDFSKDILTAISEEIEKRHPEHINGGETKDVKQIAFELADKYNLEPGAEKRIIQIIGETDSMSKTDLDRFFIDVLKLI